MDSNNQDTLKPGDTSDTVIAAALGVEETNLDMALSCAPGNESEADRYRFQRYETSCQQGASRNGRRIVIDGFVRYADKAYVAERPRPASPELVAFYAELAAAKQAKELF